MSDPAESSAKFSLPSWFFSVLGVAGSIVLMAGVLAIAYSASRPSQEVDANVVAKRKKDLADVQAKQAELYYGYSRPDPQNSKLVRIPVPQAMEIEAAKLGAETKDQPAPPARLSLAASPAGFVPPPPPVATAPAAGSAAPAASAPAPAASTPAR